MRWLQNSTAGCGGYNGLGGGTETSFLPHFSDKTSSMATELVLLKKMRFRIVNVTPHNAFVTPHNAF
jgi:hypothetical protein